MKSPPSSRLRKLAFLLKFKLTPPGRVAVLLIFLSALGSITIEIPIYQMFCGIVALFGICEATGLLLRPSLKVTGWLPDRAAAGERITGMVTIQNLGYFPAFDLMGIFFGMPKGVRHENAAEFIPCVRRGETASIPIVLLGEARGEYLLPELHVHSTFPLNLMRFGGSSVTFGRLTILPSYFPLERLELPMSRRYQPGGMLVDTRTGNPPEYVGNREYVPGEPVRRLDFRAWARLGKPVVREYQDEFCSRIALVLDTYQPAEWRQSRRENSAAIEAAVSLTASVAASLGESESIIDLFAAGPDLFLFQTTAGMSHLEAVLEILAAVEATAKDPFEKFSPVVGESLESISVLVCVLLNWDEIRQSFVQMVIETGCAVRVLLVRDGETALPFPDEALFSQLSPRSILNGEWGGV